jgi:phenylacetate-CoA ligase
MNTQVRYHQRRLADVASALRLARNQTSREHGSRAELAHHQQQRLNTVVRSAATHSPFYRRWLAKSGALSGGTVQLRRLPVLDRSLLMEHFDELVCDPRLRRDRLLDWVGQMPRDQLYQDRYRVMLTSGSAGRAGLFVYDADGWRSVCAQVLRTSRWAGLRPSLPRQRVALLGGAAPLHVSRQVAATVAIGLHRVLSLPVTLPLPQLVQALNQFQPTYLHAYPSVAMWLADEQQAGRLRIAPHSLVTIAELRTPEMTRRLQEAFGVPPFNAFGCTEGLWGSECEHHQGIHLFEDTTLVENVDADGQPVPAGEPGARLLLTNLHNLVQPLIRLEVTDVVTLDPEPCPCGRSLVRASTIHGRSDDVLSLPAHDGAPIAIHPLHFALLTRDPAIVEFQVRQRGPALTVLVVPARSSNPATAAGASEWERRLQQAVVHQLVGLGIHEPQVTVECRHDLPRSAGGKLRLVIADPTAQPAHTDIG